MVHVHVHVHSRPAPTSRFLAETEQSLSEQLSVAEAELDSALRDLKRTTSEVVELRNHNVVLTNEMRVNRSVADETQQNVCRFLNHAHHPIAHFLLVDLRCVSMVSCDFVFVWCFHGLI